MAADAVIRVADLRKTYRDGFLGQRRIEALRGVSFEVAPGEIFGLLGPNGAGKTTLIKVLLGIVRRSSGRAELFGLPAGDRRGRKQVGYLPENHRIPRHHTANSALEYYGGLSGLSRREVAARRGNILDIVGLAKWGRTSVRKFSKGMLQRLGLAQAMLHQPTLLVLDEPTDGVDPVGRSDMRKVLEQLKSEGKSIFINSHLLQEVELVCDKVVILHQGTVQKEASIDDLTMNTTGEVELSLAASADAVRVALCEFNSSLTCKEVRVGLVEATIRVTQQGDVDRSVDALRRDGISILSLAPKRKTLEEAFLDIVQHAKEQA